MTDIGLRRCLPGVAALPAMAPPAHSQTAERIATPPAALFRVEEGVFALMLGQSIDHPNGPFHLKGLMADRQVCFLDVVAIDAAKGVEPSATFRLHCV